MDPVVWLSFFVTETVLCFAPGPSVLYVIAQGLGRGTLPSVAGNLGILSGNAIYFLLSATGLGALILASHDIFFAIKWVGVAYLIWLGIGVLRGKGGPLSVQAAADAGHWRVFRGALILQLANPKALLFFAALLPQFIDPAGHIPLQIAILGVTSVTAEFLVLLFYGLAAGRVSHWARRPRFATWSNRMAGGLLIAAGLGMAAIRRGD